MSWAKRKLKPVIAWLTRMFEYMELGPLERVTLPFKFLAVSSITLVLVFSIGAHYDSVRFLYVWLFLLSMWAILHVKKSTTTWGKFEEIDQREADFAEEVDKRFEQLIRDVKTLKEAKKAQAAQVRQEKKDPKKKGKRTKKVQRTNVEQNQQVAPAEPKPEENKE